MSMEDDIYGQAGTLVPEDSALHKYSSLLQFGQEFDSPHGESYTDNNSAYDSGSYTEDDTPAQEVTSPRISGRHSPTSYSPNFPSAGLVHRRQSPPKPQLDNQPFAQDEEKYHSSVSWNMLRAYTCLNSTILSYFLIILALALSAPCFIWIYSNYEFGVPSNTVAPVAPVDVQGIVTNVKEQMKDELSSIQKDKEDFDRRLINQIELTSQLLESLNRVESKITDHAELDAIKEEVQKALRTTAFEQAELDELRNRLDTVQSSSTEDLRKQRLEIEALKIKLHDLSERDNTVHLVNRINQLENFIKNGNFVKDYVDTDRVPMVDYALAPGGSVFDYEVPTIAATDGFDLIKKKLKSFLFRKLNSGTADNILNPGILPGNCWFVDGTSANITIALPCPIVITDITIDHAHPKISRDMTTAPKDFRVYGINADGIKIIEKELIMEGVYTLDDQNVVKTFPVQQISNKSYNLVRFEFLSNHGGNSLCIYRVRVHSSGRSCVEQTD
eukprot:TRINITY_DN5661_c0_g1_i2.p1 TRINITY_DN5661_c0_g1~~TRINITY_DN5661_c0_g1_i2.p1  ORF type:complete len:501 (-),score=90.72 TRINITY_DN5661_c0_g1_i2:63-1565(-)